MPADARTGAHKRWHKSCLINVPVSEAGFRRKLMLYWAAVFFIIAIIAALFGFGGIAAAATDIARILFFVFLVLFVLALLGNFMGGPHAPGV